VFATAGQNPYTPGELALLALAGLAIALAGALGPAIRAAASRTTHRAAHRVTPGPQVTGRSQTP
jgi:hypothetical protein